MLSMSDSRHLVTSDVHPSSERLAEYVDHRLNTSSRGEVEHHLAVCEICRAVVADSALFANQEAGTNSAAWLSGRVLNFQRKPVFIATAIGLSAAAVLVLAMRTIRPSDGIAGLKELKNAVAAERTRPLEGRLFGFPHGLRPALTRGGRNQTSADLRIAAATVERSAVGRETPSANAALGVAYAAVGDLDDAISRLEVAHQADASNVAYLIDLSAVYLERGRLSDTIGDYERAKTLAERAAIADPRSEEACFNLALAMEYLSTNRAATVWLRCLSLESDPAWAAEIQDRLSRKPR